jgi:DNA-binding HxlR family transcriptional regulator
MARVSTHRQWTPLAHALTAAGDHWKLLIVLALAPGPVRLSNLKERVPGISAGVLDHHVQQMIGFGLLSRRRYREVPPRVEIELSEAGRELLPIASALTRWGIRHQWSTPLDHERVEADAILRQIPALLHDDGRLADGTLEAVLMIDGGRVCHRFRIRDGKVESTDAVGHAASTCIEGEESAWIAALGPTLDPSGLRIRGNKQLARQVFDALATIR